MDGNITQCIRIACWVTKATDTHSEYVMHIAFYSNNGYANVPQCYVYICDAPDVRAHHVTL